MGHPIVYGDLLGDFKPPDNPEAKVWRFMSFARYLDLLESKSLFFARVSSFDDQWEGAKAQYIVAARERFGPALPKHVRESVGGSEVARDLTFASCWHLNEYESQGMWKLYVQGAEGVAIQSRYAVLDSCLRESSFKSSMYVGCVKYLDHRREKGSMLDDWVTPFIYKRHSFRHESEVRAIIFPKGRPKARPNALQPGIAVGVDLNRLIEAVYVSPYSAPWFRGLVSRISEKFDLRASIRPSELTESPCF